ncbi:hypothetical protein GF351_04915 [Candidatus Woesearchaeota archaeon]|nr:hypothetical protein [Candidatus Woesearchaeota archaeon]
MIALPGAEADIYDDLEHDLKEVDISGLPKPMVNLVGNERINIYIKMDDTSVVAAGIVTKEGRIESFQKNELENPTLKVFTSEYTIRNIKESQDPLKAAQQAIREQEIRYEPVGLGNKIKYGTVGTVMRVFGWVQSLFG